MILALLLQAAAVATLALSGHPLVVGAATVVIGALFAGRAQRRVSG